MHNPLGYLASRDIEWQESMLNMLIGYKYYTMERLVY